MKISILIHCALTVLAATFIAAPATAQERRYSRDYERDRARFQSQHWRWDNRYNHNHYYPSVGYAVPVLPAGHLAINYRGGRYFYQSGVWFHYNSGRYMVVRPPRGLVVPALPAGYVTVWVGRVPYYYANEVYYTDSPNGYAVADAPGEVQWQEQAQQQPQIQATPQPQYSAGAAQGDPAQPAPGVWYYCDSVRAYYPYVQSCAEAWRAVPATPPPSPR